MDGISLNVDKEEIIACEERSLYFFSVVFGKCVSAFSLHSYTIKCTEPMAPTLPQGTNIYKV